MLISIEKLKNIYTDKDFSKFSDERLQARLEAIESALRRYTHNSFQNRNFRVTAKAEGGTLYGDFRNFKVDDTIEINGGINEGLYTVVYVDETSCTVDKIVFDVDKMIVTKVVYPADVVEGCIELLDYDANRRTQANSGITSESISRHSVSYKQYSESNTIEGYPSEMFGFARKYVNWRT